MRHVTLSFVCAAGLLVSSGFADSAMGVEASEASPATLLASGEHLLGAIAYAGGFQTKVEMKLQQPEIVRRFRLAIPSYCEGVDILEAGTVSEGVQDVADAVGTPNGGVFSVNKGAGQRISAVFASLNGPTGKTCQIPVFAVDEPSSDPVCNVSLFTTQTLINSSWPDPVWTSYYVKSFYAKAAWSLPVVQPLASGQDLSLTNAASCVAYVRVEYDAAACNENFYGDTNQTQFMGEDRVGTHVSKLYGLVSTHGTYNLCLDVTHPVLFYHGQ